MKSCFDVLLMRGEFLFRKSEPKKRGFKQVLRIFKQPRDFTVKETILFDGNLNL